VLFSTGGAAIKATALAGWQVACLRSGIAAVTLLLLAPGARRGWTWRTTLVGVSYAATMILFVLANKLTTSANTIFLQATAPLYILILGPLLLREPVHRRDLGFMLAMGAGLALFFVGNEAPGATAPDPFRGNLFAALSGLCWAFTMCGLRWLGSDERNGTGIAAAVSGNVIACLVALPFALPIVDASAVDWAVIGYLGVFQIALAYVFVTGAMRRVTALEASVLLLVEPALNPVWAWLVHGERPRNWALAGAVIIFGATMYRTWRESRRATVGTGGPIAAGSGSGRG
jgi:drug/metabolite transporter (DMT)-like permease